MMTVLFATRNRARLLRRVLDTFTLLEPPPGGCKLVVVDNGSTDDTQTVLADYRGPLPLEHLQESRLGKNHALNTGLNAAEGDLVVLTDDDVFPRADWLARFRAAADAHPDFDIFGGAVVPRWESAPAPWILAWVPLAPVFTLTHPGLREGPTGAHNVYGPNMLIRRALFEEGQRFDTTIGPQGSSYAMGSETELVRRLLRHGHRAWHVQDAIVEHFIRAEQLSQRWIMARAVRFGRGQYRLAQIEATSSSVAWGGVPRYLFRSLAAGALSIAGSWISRDSRRLFRARWDFNYTRGQLLEAYALSRSHKSHQPR